MPLILDAGVPNDDIIHEDRSTNTREQAMFVIDLAIANNWNKLILVATHDHQYRAYLTFLRVILDMHLQILLFNAPARNLKWFSENPWGRRFDRLESEFDRIDRYYQLGHLASFNDAIHYQKWKEEIT